MMDSQMAVRLSVIRAGGFLHTVRFMVLISVIGLVNLRDIVCKEELGTLKNPMISGIGPATFQLAA
jgi:hypothetical protein